MIEDHAVVLTPEEAQEVAGCLKDRREDLTKEKKRMEDRRLGTGVIDEALAIHLGDGATSGLVSKFAPRDNCDLFEDPDPVGDITVVGGKTGKRVLSEGAPFGQLSTDLFRGKLKPESAFGAKVIDSEGTVFELGIFISTQFHKKGTICQKDGCEMLAVEGVPCQAEGCPQNPPEPTKAPEKPKSEAKPPTEGEVDAKVLENRKALAIEAVNSATDLPVAERRYLIQFVLESAGDAWLTAVIKREEGKPFPSVPKGWKPAGKDEGTPEDYTGLLMTGVAEIIAKERNVPRLYLDGQGTGQGGKLTKGDVEDAINRWISTEAQKN